MSLHSEKPVNSTGRHIILNIYTTKMGTTKYIKHILIHLKGENSSNIKKVGDFNSQQ